LRSYAEKSQAQKNRWDFLTGSRSAIYTLASDGFKLPVSENSDDAGNPVHSTRFVLVDGRGVIRGYYDALAADGVTKLLADANHLLRDRVQ